jgi:hypothetical protein
VRGKQCEAVSERIGRREEQEVRGLLLGERGRPVGQLGGHLGEAMDGQDDGANRI